MAAISRDFKVKNAISSPYIKEFSTTADVGSANPSTLDPSLYLQHVNVSPVSSTYNLLFSEDGTEGVVSSTTSLYSVEFSTAYDISTLNYSGSNSYSTIGTAVGGAASPDGLNLYTTTYSDGGVVQYKLTSPWDVSSIYSTTTQDLGLSWGYVAGIDFNSDGSVFTVAGLFNGETASFRCSTPYDITTATLIGEVAQLYPSGGNPGYAYSVRYAGDKFLRIDYNSDLVLFFSNIDDTCENMSYIGYFSFASVGLQSVGIGLSLNPDFSRLYITSTSQDIYEYNVDAPSLEVDLSKGSVFYLNSPKDSEIKIKNSSDKDSLTAATVIIDGDSVASFDVDDLTRVHDLDVKSLFSLGTSNTHRSLRFNDTGSKLYVSDTFNDTIYEADLSTNWSVSSASYNSVSLTPSQFSSQVIADFAFKSNGSVLYVVGYSDFTIYQYNLTTPYDLSSASYGSISYTLSSPNTLAVVRKIQFKPDGSKMYVLHEASSGTDYIQEYSLSTLWNVSTATLDDEYICPYQNANTFDIHSDGINIIIGALTTVKSFQYETAWDLSSTATETGSKSISSIYLTNFYAVCLGDGGNKLYFNVYDNNPNLNYVSEFDMINSGTFIWGSGAVLESNAQTTPDVNKTNVYNVSTTDGGKSYKVTSVIQGAV